MDKSSNLKFLQSSILTFKKAIEDYKSSSAAMYKQEDMMTTGDVNTAAAGSSAAMKSEEEPHKDDPHHEEKEKKIAQKVKALAEKQLEMHKSLESLHIAANGQWTLEMSETDSQ
jgi:predicted  nucleic acid-binding Zn-ribbon protein